MSKKKAFDYDDFHFREVAKMYAQLERESDRAVALILSAWIDDALSEMIKRKLVDDKKLIEETFQFNSALGTFSSRIALGYLIRRFSKTIFENLTTIRKIRNEFAHSRADLNFAEPSIAGHCKNLHLQNFNGQPVNARNAFVATGIALLGVFIEFISAETLSADGKEDYAINFIEHMRNDGAASLARFISVQEEVEQQTSNRSI